MTRAQNLRMVWERRRVQVLVLLGVSVFAAAGCGGTVEDDSPPPTGGSGGSGSGSGGTGGSGGSGGDSTNTVPSASGVSITLSPSTIPNGGRSCNAGTLGAFTYQIGQPQPGKTIESGTQGVMVDCAVELDDSGNTQLNATISGTDANGDKPMALSVTSQIAAGDPVPPATFTFFSPDTGPLTVLTSYPSCTLGPITVLKSGAILADIDCPLIGAVDDNTSGCRVTGTIAFEYCATGRPPATGDEPPSGP
jgi:hypothetical protein